MGKSKNLTPEELAELPPFCRDFLNYLRTVRSLSPLTVREYYFDLRTFCKYVKTSGSVSVQDFDRIDVSDLSLDELRKVNIQFLYSYQAFCMTEKNNSARSRMRKISSLKSFYKYLMSQKLISENPTVDLLFPKAEKTLPHYLTFEQSFQLLNSIDGRFKARNLAIVTLFLNCGIRLSELVGLNDTSIRDRSLRVRGKGNKERELYLNDACIAALQAYREERRGYTFKITDPHALFISQKGNRISQRMVQVMVKEFMRKCGIDTTVYSVHKLRHTAATLMYQSGVDVRILQEILGHTNLGTTQIYTHINNSQIQESMKKLSIGNGADH